MGVVVEVLEIGDDYDCVFIEGFMKMDGCDIYDVCSVVL